MGVGLSRTDGGVAGVLLLHWFSVRYGVHNLMGAVWPFVVETVSFDAVNSGSSRRSRASFVEKSSTVQFRREVEGCTVWPA